MNRSPLAVLFVVCALSGAASAAERDDKAVRKALADELARTMKELKLGNEPRPYHVAYQVTDTEGAYASATRGALITTDVNRHRRLRVDLRVGSAKADNGNFLDNRFAPSSYGLPIEDDYGAIRKEIWLATDASYKRALQALAKKQASEQRQARREDDPSADFTEAKPVTVEETEGPAPKVEQAALQALVTRLSALLRDYPDLHSSLAFASQRTFRKRLLSSEGTWTDERRTYVRVTVTAETQAGDGMRLDGYVPFFARSVAELPSAEEMEKAARQMADEVIAQRKAVVPDGGNAVVLFEGRAAGQIVRRMLADHVSGTPPPKAGEGRSFGAPPESEFATRLGQRIGPAFLNVHDDPKAETVGTVPLFGAYTVDDEGVPAERVSLIEGGVLKSLYMSRTPRKEIARSNGHGRGLPVAGAIRGRPGNVFVTPAKGAQGTKNALAPAALRARAFKLAKESNGTVYVVRMVDSGNALSGEGDGGRSALRPIAVYRLKDAKSAPEPVRGITLEGLLPRTFKSIAAMGKEPYVYNTGNDTGPDDLPTAFVTPALLFGDVEVRKETGKHPKPPLYPIPPLEK